MINLLKKPYKKKASKFQPFRKFFGRRKKRETTPDREETKLKASSSFGNICNDSLSSDEETNDGLRSSSFSMGTRAISHDSIFIPDGRAESEESIQEMSQDNLVGKVKTLQQQLAKNIKFGQPAQVTVSVRVTGEADASLEPDMLLETAIPLNVAPTESHRNLSGMPDSLSLANLHETGREVDEKVTPVKASSRPKRHHSPSGTIESVNLDAIPLAIACLDNSAAKHKLAVKPKNQRVSKKHRLSKEMQSVITTEFEQETLESQCWEDEVSKDDDPCGPDKSIQHKEVHEQKPEGKQKDHSIYLEAWNKIQMAETEFKNDMDHKRLQEFEGGQGEQVGKKQKLQEKEQLHQMEEKKDQERKKKHEKQRCPENQVKRQEERETQGRKEEGPEKLQAQSQQEEDETQGVEEEKRRNQEQKLCELEAQRQQEEQKQRELEVQRQQEEAKKQREKEIQRQDEQKQRELEVQRQQEEAKRQQELELQRQEERKQHELEVQRQQEEAKRQQELELQRQEERKQHELEVQRQQEEAKRQQELELQRQEEQKQHELEVQRQQEEAKRQQELELQKQEERKQHELEVQRQQEEAKRQQELELQRQEEQKQHELEVQRQQEEAKRQQELELQKQEERKQHELEVQRQQEEAKRQQELELQRQEEQKQRELEVQRQQEEAKQQQELELQRQEEQKQRELEVQRQEEAKRQQELEVQSQEERKQHELEVQRQEEAKRQQELEVQHQKQKEQKHHELEAQKQLQEEHKLHEPETQRQLEGQRQHGLEMQWQQEEEKNQQEPATQRQQEEKQKSWEPVARGQHQEQRKWCEMEAQWQEKKQRHRACGEEKEQTIEDPKEEHQETEEHNNLIQQGWKDKTQEPEKEKWQEERLIHQDLEKWRVKELKKVQTNESEKQSEPNQQLLQVQKRETGQRHKEQENGKNLDDGEKLQGREIDVKRKGPDEQQQNMVAKELSRNEQKQQESDKQTDFVRKLEPADVACLWAKKEIQQEELIQREEGLELEGWKLLSLEGCVSLEKPNKGEKSHQLQMNINKHSEDKNLETTEKELKEESSQEKGTQPGQGQAEERNAGAHQGMNVEVQEQERDLGEELRWQEVDVRQTMPRGFTFQVSSGEKQIIFPKVNLSPVTPVKEAPAPSAPKESKTPKSSKGPHTLPTSMCVPHTAILVTGAQLCGSAANINQIKDTACKSLLGLTEEKKVADVAHPECPQELVDVRLSSSKMKYAQDSADNQAILAEWASIRSKIFKSAENGKLNERERESLNRHSDDWSTKGRKTSHSNLRKTLSANAKFSITPAWQKFSEISKTNTAAENKTGPEAENTTKQFSPSNINAQKEESPAEALGGVKTLEASTGKSKIQHEVAGNTEGCKFAKDLPSFLVPSIPYILGKDMPQSETSGAMKTPPNIDSKKLEETVSPFGVKLRRTNYSLRFHYDQQIEQKKKKRYSAGDSFDGPPAPLVTPDNEQDVKPLILKDSKSLSEERKDAGVHSAKATLTIMGQNYTIAAPVSSPTAPSQEKSVCKSPLPPKPALAPKPISQTPPSSPLSKIRRSHLTEPMGKRGAKVDPDTSWRKTEMNGSPLSSQSPTEGKNEEEESREKKSFFPSITMPWRERPERKPEPMKRERPILQSRHSIDGSKLMEKAETVQPLWITLALQKQKGFREQQASREERRQAREAKQAEKLAKENTSINNQTDNKSNQTDNKSNKSNVLPKSTIQEEEKKIETVMSRFERREQLKKSNTLPSSVTVEITDPVSSPLAKEVTKRFSAPDANSVSTEPAWLALAKRKAKAWSDCPQIIK